MAIELANHIYRDGEGVPVVLMSPQYFLERPVRWLEAISRYRGTISGGPDFAYRLCNERVSSAALASLDLSCWRVAYSGSEPIRQDSLDSFADKFAACGFVPSSFFASYGLAEATLFVSGSVRGGGIPALALDSCDILVVLQGGGVAAVLHPRTDPVEALQSALAAVYGPLELVPVTDRTGRVRLALLPL